MRLTGGMRQDPCNDAEESNFGGTIMTAGLTCRKSSRTSCSQRELELTDSSSVSQFLLCCASNIFLCLRYIEYWVELIYGRSVMTRVPDRMDKVAVVGRAAGPRGTEESVSLAEKTRTSGDWRVTREKDCECTA